MEDFFASYLAAFERQDAAAIARYFAYPLHVVGDADEITPAVVATAEEWLPQVERLVRMYQTIGVSGVRILDLVTTPLSPRLWQTVVHWKLSDAAGQVLYDFQAAYTLATIQERPAIVAIAHNELPRLRASLARIPS